MHCPLTVVGVPRPLVRGRRRGEKQRAPGVQLFVLPLPCVELGAAGHCQAFVNEASMCEPKPNLGLRPRKIMQLLL